MVYRFFALTFGLLSNKQPAAHSLKLTASRLSPIFMSVTG